MWWYAIFYCLNFQNQFRQVFLIVNITAVQLRKVFYKWKNLNVNDFKTHFVLPKLPHNWIWCFFPNLITFWYFNLYQKKFSKTQLYFPPTTTQLHSWRGAVGAGLALAGLTTTEANSKMFLFCFYLLNWEFTKKWGVSWK